MPTLSDLARAARVSKAAVSYAFSDNPEKRAKIAPETRARILELAAEIGYKPNIMGRAFSLSKSFNIALLLPESCKHSISQHFLGMFHGVSTGIGESDYNLSVFLGFDQKLLDSIAGKRVDGLIVVGRLNESSVYSELVAEKIPFVVLNRRKPLESEYCSAVCSDSEEFLRSRLEAFQQRRARRTALFIRDLDKYAIDVELAGLLNKIGGGYGLECAVFGREEFSPALAAQFDGLIFRGVTPEIEGYLSRPEAMEKSAVIVSMEGRSSMLPPEICFYHNSTVIGQTGAELMLQILAGETGGREERVAYFQHWRQTGGSSSKHCDF